MFDVFIHFSLQRICFVWFELNIFDQIMYFTFKLLQLSDTWRWSGSFESEGFFWITIDRVEEVEASPLEVDDENVDTADKFNELVFLSGNCNVLEGIIKMELFHVHDTESAQ